MIADLLHRAGYIEKVGSGFSRIQNSLQENNNPPYEISATNFFDLRFKKRVGDETFMQLTPRQLKLLEIIRERGNVSTRIAAIMLDISNDTVLSDLHALIQFELICKEGKGKATIYKIKQE